MSTKHISETNADIISENAIITDGAKGFGNRSWCTVWGYETDLAVWHSVDIDITASDAQEIYS